ncbi:MAG: hypothetical protein J7L19_02820 [Dehalococcoidia bacterium]|nr:hypothetical protein [Dehalococcoidia bacterium]
METLVRLGALLSPSFFAILAGLSLTAAVLLFVTGKSKGVDTQAETGKLSKSEPVENRYTVYLMLAFSWSMPGLVLSFISGAIGIRPFWSPFLVILLLICLLLTLCFLYAGAGALLHAVTGQRIGFASRRFPPVRYIDDMIVKLGNVLTLGLLKQVKYTGGATKDVIVGKPEDVAAGVKKQKLPIEEEKLQRVLAEYEASLTPEQRAKLVKMRGIAEELKNTYPEAYAPRIFDS